LTEWRIPLSDLEMGEEELEAVAGVLRSRWLTMGPRTQEFEQAFARHHEVDHAIAVSSATAALHLACATLDLSPGDEVILPANTFVATANVAVLCGAQPMFADIVDAGEPNIDPDHAAALITSRTRAIVVTHYGGYPCRMEELASLARRHGLVLVEDCAHAPGVRFGERFLGNWGSAGCFSFFSNKNMSTGEGGMVTTSDPKRAERIRLLRSHGMTSGTWKRHHERPQGYDVLEVGWNYRIDEMRSAIGLVQLSQLDRRNARRREIVALYRTLLADVAGAALCFDGQPQPTAAHLASLVVAEPATRQRVVTALTEAGIQTSNHYPPIHLFTGYRERFGYRDGMLPKAESFATRQITLPLSAALRDEQVDSVCQVIRHALQGTVRHARRVAGDS
jgi:dTDP-4-amino-4,6-dideoxygalactose transaminase